MYLRTPKNHITHNTNLFGPPPNRKNMDEKIGATICFQTDLSRRGAAPCLFQVAQFNRNVNENRGVGGGNERG